MIYLASPYTHSDGDVRRQRFDSACRAAATLISQGKTVFSPIAHSHAICAYGLPLDWRFWERHDRRYLEVCDEVVVLMLDGWRESVGVQAEIGIARELGKPVSFVAMNSQAEENPGQGRGCERRDG
jgi:nucleoside 2-deoxyribosyltransferase